MKISTEEYQSLLQRYKTAKITAQSFAAGHDWLNQMNQAYENMDWQWLDNLCTGIVQAREEYIEKNKPDARRLPVREATALERLNAARKRQ